MGFIALALASAAPRPLLSKAAAVERVRRGLLTALERLPHTAGIMPHFVDPRTALAVGHDQRSTIDSGWLIAGAMWAAAFLRHQQLEELAIRLYERVDWNSWAAPPRSPTRGLIGHGADAQGAAFNCAWDRVNGETIFLYVLAAGAKSDKAWEGTAWPRLAHFVGSTGGNRFISADLGLFVFQYGFDLLDLESWQEPGGVDFQEQAAVAAEANYRVCREAAERFETYRHYWGLSAGDGPGDSAETDIYRCYAPEHDVDGTAHLTATLASVASQPDLVMENLMRAHRDRELGCLGKYGFSPINLDRAWVGRDMVGIDAGAAVLALDNVLHDGRIRRIFHQLPAVQRGLERIGFRHIIPLPTRNTAPLRAAS